MELLWLTTVRRGGEQDEPLAWLLRDVADKVVALLLAGRSARRPCARVGFVHDHQFWTLFDEYLAARVRLDEVDTDNLVGIVVVHAGVTLDLAVEARLGVRPDNDGLQVKLGPDFLLPLFAQVWEADNSEAFNFSPF